MQLAFTRNEFVIKGAKSSSGYRLKPLVRELCIGKNENDECLVPL